MNIKYHKEDQILEIKDNLGTVYLLLKIVMLLNILMTIAHLNNSGFKLLGLFDYLYFLIGLSSVGVLLFLIFKKSTEEMIPLDHINRLREKSFFGKRTFSLELKNGKVRDLNHVKTKSEIEALKKLFVDVGVSSKEL